MITIVQVLLGLIVSIRNNNGLVVHAIDLKVQESEFKIPNPEIQQHQLTQVDLSKVKIPLSETCENQRQLFFQKNNFGKNPDHQKYNFKVVPLKLGEFRIAFVGDSISEGYFGTTLEKRAKIPLQELMTDNKLGYTNGQINGYPSKLRQLLRDNNATTNYAFLQYSYGGAKLIDTGDDESIYGGCCYYLKTCRYEQLKKSLPHVIFSGIGYMDSLNPNFNVDEYTKKLTSFVQTLQNLPTKPIVMLFVPPTTKNFAHGGKLCRGANINDPYFSAFSNCTLDQRLDLQQMYYQIANATGIPDYHVVNGFQVLRLNPYVAANDFFPEDSVHPNERGQAALAQDIFMKMSLSPEILERQKQVQNGQDSDWNNAVMAQLQAQEKEQSFGQK